MRFRDGAVPGYRKLSNIPDLSKDACRRLKWFDYYFANGKNARRACIHFDISPQTFYRWKRRYQPDKLQTLENHSHQPRHVRQPTWSSELSSTVLKLREENQRWGKEKLTLLLKERGFHVSVSMVGRILTRLKARGILKEVNANPISTRKRQRKRPYAIRKPKEYPIKSSGDLVQVDSMDVRPLPGIILKHFTAHDVVSKWNVLNIYANATANNASNFIDAIQDRMPFPIRALQVDGGSEFQSVFEDQCKIRGIKLFVLPPRSPKLNGGVERAHRTHTEEFYEITDADFDLPNIRQALLKWEMRYNTIRPHQSLNYLTPDKYLALSNSKSGGKVSLIT